jgi:hypothetical protein
VAAWESYIHLPPACRFEGAVNGTPYGAQRWAWRCLSTPYFLKCRGWRCSARDGAVMVGVAA